MDIYKIALAAGHYPGTAGKRIPKALDPNETREWWLNNRIADKVEQLLKSYTGYELLRLDDTTGKNNIPLSARTNAANNWGATEYYSIHHNAGINGGSGGGIVVYTYTKPSEASRKMQKELYTSLIDATGLKGDRVVPMAKANLHEVRETKMPAVLMELGFMDSKADAPIILTEEYADKCAGAIVSVMAKRGKLQKKTAASAVSVELRCVKPGDRSAEVYTLQALLNRFSGKQIGVDGNFGAMTEAALRVFQAEHALKVTGIADSETWNEILKNPSKRKAVS